MKKIIFISLLFGQLTLLSQICYASSSIGVTRTSTTDSQTQGFTATYENEVTDKEDFKWSLTGDFAQTQSNTTDETDTSVESIWETPKKWTMGIGYDFSSDTVNKITGSQPFIILEKKFIYGKHLDKKTKIEGNEDDDAKDKEDFSPYFKIKTKFAHNQIYQTIATKVRPTKFEAIQSWSQVGFEWRFIELLSLSAYYKKFLYDKDMSALLKQLDNPLVKRPILTKNLTSTLSSFYNYEYSYGFTVYPYESLEIELTQTKNESLASLAIATDNSIAVTYYINDNWEICVGTSQTSFSDATTSTTSTTGTLTYNF